MNLAPTSQAFSTGIGGQFQANQTATKGQIQSELEYLHKAVDDLQAAMSEHVAKLGPCLQPCPEGKGETTKPQELLVPLAEMIRSPRQKLEQLTSCLRFTTTLIQF